MHRPENIGDEFQLEVNDSFAYHYTCSSTNMDDCLKSNKKSINPAYASRSDGPEQLNVEVISTEPRVFRIKNFLSEFECDFIVAMATPKLERSTTGSGENTRVDNVRTSQSAWLTRSHGDVMDAVYRRIGVATHIPQELIRESKIAENLNVLRYPVGGEYTPHYDVGADGQTASRFISGLLYLNTPEEGGGTSFPKAVNEDGSLGMYLDAEKGSMVFFYDLLEDGNVDERSLHSGTKVIKGHKWVSPLWLWEPSRNGGPHGFGDLSQGALDAAAGKQTGRDEL
jgi:prolyl 4-hydroxylase